MLFHVFCLSLLLFGFVLLFMPQFLLFYGVRFGLQCFPYLFLLNLLLFLPFLQLVSSLDLLQVVVPDLLLSIFQAAFPLLCLLLGVLLGLLGCH